MTQELYALSNERTATLASRFLNTFGAELLPFAEDFPVPEFSVNPAHVFRRVEDLISFLELNRSEPYGLYWNVGASEGEIAQAMLFYTTDGGLILGLAVTPESAPLHLRRLMTFAGTDDAMYGDEQRPPETSGEFVAKCRKGTGH